MKRRQKILPRYEPPRNSVVSTIRVPSIFFFCFSLILSVSNETKAGNAAFIPIENIQAIVSEFLLELELAEHVQVAVEPRNQRLVSVERLGRPEDGFLMSFDESFLADLTEEELRATIAHELGHVWIFTHHPYLQTEELANRIALKLVPRGSLEQIYQRAAHVSAPMTFTRINYLPPPEENITP